MIKIKKNRYQLITRDIMLTSSFSFSLDNKVTVSFHHDFLFGHNVVLLSCFHNVVLLKRFQSKCSLVIGQLDLRKAQ